MRYEKPGWFIKRYIEYSLDRVSLYQAVGRIGAPVVPQAEDYFSRNALMDDLEERITACERKGYTLVDGSTEAVWWFGHDWRRMPKSWQDWASQEGLTEEHVSTTLNNREAEKKESAAKRAEHQRVISAVREREKEQRQVARSQTIEDAEDASYLLDRLRDGLAEGRDVERTGWLDELDDETIPVFPKREPFSVEAYRQRVRDTYIGKTLPHESLSEEAAAAFTTMVLWNMDLPEDGLADYPNLTDLMLGPDGALNSPLRIPDSLRSLRFHGTDYSIGSVADGLSNLETLSFFVDGMPDLNHIQQLPKLRNLATVGRGIRQLLEHVQLPSLESLQLREEIPADLGFLRHVPHITSLTLVDASVDLAGLSDGLELESLALARCTADLSCLQELTTLKSLTIAHEDVETLPPITTLTALETLVLDLPSARTLDVLRSLTSLTTLTLKLGPGYTNLDAIGALTALHTLTVHNSGATDLSALRSLPQLRTLDLKGNSCWDGDTSVLSGTKRLQKLTLHQVPPAAVTGLPYLPNLEDLDIAPTQPVDLRSLPSKLNRLKRLVLDEEPIDNTHDWFKGTIPENAGHEVVYAACTTTIAPTERPWPSTWLHSQGNSLSFPETDALLAVVYDVGRPVPLQAWILDSEGTPHLVEATAWDERLGRLKEPILAFEALVADMPDSFSVVRHQSYGVICPTPLATESNGARRFLEDLEGLTDHWVRTALTVLGWHAPTQGELAVALRVTADLTKRRSHGWDMTGEPLRVEQFQRALLILSDTKDRATPGESFAHSAHAQLTEWLTDHNTGPDLCPLSRVLPQPLPEPAAISVQPPTKNYHPFATTVAPMPTLPTLKSGRRLRQIGCTGLMAVEPIRGTDWSVVRIGPQCGYGDAEAYGELSFEFRPRESYAPHAWGEVDASLAETAVNPVTSPQWFATARSLPMRFNRWKHSFSSHHVSGGWDYDRISGAPGCLTVDADETLRRVQEAVELDRFLLSQTNGKLDKATIIAGMVAKQDLEGGTDNYPVYSGMETEDVTRVAQCREFLRCLATATSDVVDVPVYGQAYRLRLPPVAYTQGFDNKRVEVGAYEVFVVPCVSQDDS